MYRHAAGELDRAWDANDSPIRRLSTVFVIALCALGIEAFALAALLTGTLI
ncbi:MAG: hypothetical protein JSU06_07140 [Actinobacteria bacterium]|nr:hypothetical protein [Actinomycetota bacterium]